MRILAGNGIPVPPPDRATLRRFRRLVSDLGADLYVAVTGEKVVGFVHVTYTRQLTAHAHARLEALTVEKEFHGRGVGSSLVALASRRVRRRGCARLSCEAGHGDDQLRTFLGRRGWANGLHLLRLELPPAGTETSSSMTVSVDAADARSSDA